MTDRQTDRQTGRQAGRPTPSDRDRHKSVILLLQFTKQRVVTVGEGVSRFIPVGYTSRFIPAGLYQ